MVSRVRGARGRPRRRARSCRAAQTTHAGSRGRCEAPRARIVGGMRAPARYARPVDEVTVTVRANGPYKIVGPITLLDADGRAFELPAGTAVALCRCGQSRDEAVLRRVAQARRLRRGRHGPAAGELEPQHHLVLADLDAPAERSGAPTPPRARPAGSARSAPSRGSVLPRAAPERLPVARQLEDADPPGRRPRPPRPRLRLAVRACRPGSRARHRLAARARARFGGRGSRRAPRPRRTPRARPRRRRATRPRRSRTCS